MVSISLERILIVVISIAVLWQTPYLLKSLNSDKSTALFGGTEAVQAIRELRASVDKLSQSKPAENTVDIEDLVKQFSALRDRISRLEGIIQERDRNDHLNTESNPIKSQSPATQSPQQNLPSLSPISETPKTQKPSVVQTQAPTISPIFAGDEIVLSPQRKHQLDTWYSNIAATVGKMSSDHDIAGILSKAPVGSVILDIGANVGAFTEYVAEKCTTCKVHAFEPVPDYAQFIRNRNANNPNIHVNSVAIGDAVMNVTLWVDTHNLGWNTLIGEQKTEGMTPIITPMVPLDMWAKQHSVKDLYFVKIDVEGAEYKVLKGMRTFLQSLPKKPILFIEIGWGVGHPDWKDELVEFDWLFDHGYQKKDLSNVRGTSDHLFLPA